MKKKFLKITGVIIICLGLGGFWGYNKYLKPDTVVQQQLNDQFGAEFFAFDDQTVADSGADTNGQSSNNEPANSGASTNNGVSNIEVKSADGSIDTSKTASSTPVTENTAPKQVTQEEINLKYEPKFNNLQGLALGRLDTLYSAAIQEYEQGRKDGTLNRAALAQKYLQAGKVLEANVDSKFNSTLNEMQAELVANNFPTDIVATTKAKYDSAKSAKRSQLFSKLGK